MHTLILSVPLIFLLLPGLCLAQGGPPLITDDPDTPGSGHWEINIADINLLSENQSLFQVPYFDLNYGWGERIQLKLEGGLGFSKETGSSSKSGVGSVLAGVKFRFLDQETDGISVSTYPQFSFHPFFSSTDPDLSSPGNQWLIPVEASEHFGKFAIDGEIGYEFATQSPDELFYGIVFAYEVKKDSDLLCELHANSAIHESGTELLFNVGGTYAFSEDTSLLVSAGHTLVTLPGESSQLLTYLGVQLRL